MREPWLDNESIEHELQSASREMHRANMMLTGSRLWVNTLHMYQSARRAVRDHPPRTEMDAIHLFAAITLMETNLHDLANGVSEHADVERLREKCPRCPAREECPISEWKGDEPHVGT